MSCDLRLEAPVATPEAYMLEAEDYQPRAVEEADPRRPRTAWAQLLLAVAVLLPLALVAIVLV